MNDNSSISSENEGIYQLVISVLICFNSCQAFLRKTSQLVQATTKQKKRKKATLCKQIY